MPDVVESRKQSAAKTQQLKQEPINTNGGEEGAPAIREGLDPFLISFSIHKSYLFIYIERK